MSKTSCTIGVDLGGQSVKLAVVDANGSILIRDRSPIDPAVSAADLCSHLVDQIGLIRQAARNAGLDPTAIGFVMPGIMDRQRTRIEFVANLPSLNGSSLLADLRTAMDLPIVFDADCNAAAWGEYRFGAGRAADRLIVAVVGTGIGAGVIVDGAIVRVRHHIGGSLGHVVVDARGPVCGCGGRGCVEALAAGPAIERRAREIADIHPQSLLNKLAIDRGRLSCVELRDAVAGGDPLAGEVVRECGRWLGVAAATWSVIYAPDRIILGGGVAGLGAPWLSAVREGFTAVAPASVADRTTIERANLGVDAGVIGAASLASDAKVDGKGV